MKYRRFGKTELNIPVISMGGMRFQTSWDRSEKYKKEDQEKLEKIVEHALELGINHIETARGYGTSEKQLGLILPHIDRKSYILQTKVGIRDTAEEFLADVTDSLKSLNADHVDMLAVHGINNDEMFSKGCSDEMLAALSKLKADGIAKNIGFSTHGQPDIIQKVISSDFFDYVNLWYSFISQDNDNPIEMATERDMGVFIISPNDKGGKLYAPPKRLTEATAPLHPMEFNDLFILSDPRIHTVSCGISKPEDFDLHANIVDKMDELAPQVLEIAAKMTSLLEQVDSKEWFENYKQGLPRWEETPGEMNIPTMLWIWNLVKAFDMVEFGKMRYNLLGNGGSWFPGKNANDLSDMDMDQITKAIKDSPFADRIPARLQELRDMLSGEEVKRLGGKH